MGKRIALCCVAYVCRCFLSFACVDVAVYACFVVVFSSKAGAGEEEAEGWKGREEEQRGGRRQTKGGEGGKDREREKC